MNTVENNKIIAEFMGFELTDRVILPEIYKGEESHFSILEFIDMVRESDNLPPSSINNLKFHLDWNWLMEVVEKIEATVINNIRYIDFHIMPDAVIIRNQDDEQNPLILINKSEGKGSIEIEPTLFETKIKAVCDACIIFIKWRNEQNISAKEN